ncbi:unnamed protein product [Prorocentrum cordatum]|uniref:Uncharacterized protein n=1 Tax=Prorocentrum cordatum TaxID=2364126 RepID=A0ABN9X977_9DINO|nr:unnamed protein product [Polarella glacialis]
MLLILCACMSVAILAQDVFLPPLQQRSERPAQYTPGTARMSSLAGVHLPAVSNPFPRPRPALAWAEASSAAPAPRPPSHPRTARGRPGVGERLQRPPLRRPLGGHGRAALGSDVLVRGRIHRPLGLRPSEPRAQKAFEHLPEVEKFVTGISDPRPGSGTPSWHAAEEFTAPRPWPRMELAGSSAASDHTSDTESTSDLFAMSPELSAAAAGLRLPSAVASEADRPPTWPGVVRPTGEPFPPSAPPDLDGRRGAPCGTGPGPRGGVPAGLPPRPRGEAPARCRPSMAGRSLSARGSGLPRHAARAAAEDEELCTASGERQGSWR